MIPHLLLQMVRLSILIGGLLYIQSHLLFPLILKGVQP